LNNLEGYVCGWCGYVNPINIHTDKKGNFYCRWCSRKMNVNLCNIGYK
jgi:hypothetical protein